MHELDYAELYLLLKKEAEAQGFTVERVEPDKILHDYEASNPQFAMLVGKRQGAHVIQIEQYLPWKKAYKDLNHELIEYHLMAKGWAYWPAHLYALKHDADISASLLSQMEHRKDWSLLTIRRTLAAASSRKRTSVALTSPERPPLRPAANTSTTPGAVRA